MIHTYVINKEEGRLLGLIWNLLIMTQRYKTQFCKSNVFPSQNWPHLAQKSPFPLGDQTRRTKQKLQADSFGITRVPQKIVTGEYIFSLFFFFFFLTCPFFWNIGISSRRILSKTVVAEWHVNCDHCPSWVGVLRRAELLGLVFGFGSRPSVCLFLKPLGCFSPPGCVHCGEPGWRGHIALSATDPPCSGTPLNCAHADL